MAKAATKKAAPGDEIEVFADIEQLSPEWYALKIGLMSASNFATIMASGKNGGESIGRARLMRQLAGEILTELPAETYRSSPMGRGNEMEADAIKFYAQRTFEPVTRVGFVKRTVQPRGMGKSFVVGCSPDALVGDNGIVQAKTMKPELLIEVWNKGAAGYPTEHRAQQQGEMWVTGREWNDLQLFYRGMPIAPKFRILRDDAYISELANECERFSWELQELVKRLRAAGG